MARKPPKDNKEAIALPIEWRGEAETKSVYANNMRVQRTPHEFFLAFYEVTPPHIEGSREDMLKALSKHPPALGTCVARVAVPISRLGDFAKALLAIAPEITSESPSNNE